MARIEAIMKGWRPRTEHRHKVLAEPSDSEAGMGLANRASVGMTTSKSGTNALPDRPVVAALSLKPGLVLDELILNLLPLVEAGVLEVAVDPVMNPKRIKTATIVFEECSGHRSKAGKTRRLSLKLTGSFPGNAPPRDSQCLDPSSEVVPEIRRLLRQSFGFEKPYDRM